MRRVLHESEARMIYLIDAVGQAGCAGARLARADRNDVFRNGWREHRAGAVDVDTLRDDRHVDGSGFLSS